MPHHRNRAGSSGTGLLLAVSAGAAGLLAWSALRQQPRRGSPISDAPRRSLRRPGDGKLRGQSVVGRTVTINKPREELYSFWRNFARLPSFMENVKAVQVIDEQRSQWTIAGPGGADITFISRITEDHPNERVGIGGGILNPEPRQDRISRRARRTRHAGGSDNHL